MNKTVLITGGHHTSALVVAKELVGRGHKVVWIGHKYTMKGITNESLEWRQITEAGFLFRELKTGKFHHAGLSDWVALAGGLFRAAKILLEVRPDVILSFGGYLAVPVGVAGFMLGVPVVTHEQTLSVGMANKLLKVFAKRILIAWPESAKFFPVCKTIVTGLPLRKTIITSHIERKFFSNPKTAILITGGKQGAHFLNTIVAELLPQLVSKFNVIHQCGKTSTTGDFEKLTALRRSLTPRLRSGYHLAAYLSDEEMAAALKSVSCVVSRSGAHIVYELLYLGKPAVLIPLPFSFNDEQRKNADKVATAGLAVILKQKEADAKTLMTAIGSRLAIGKKELEKLRGESKKQIILDAKERIVEILENLPAT